jgi:hypothetical protein
MGRIREWGGEEKEGDRVMVLFYVSYVVLFEWSEFGVGDLNEQKFDLFFIIFLHFKFGLIRFLYSICCP